jgi:hypothetical protein
MGLFFAWSVGEGIITWRWVKNHAPPTPGALLLPTALYLSLAILAEYRPARGVATAFAWAVNLAILMQVVGKAPAQATGWPPPKMLNTQIWPGGASAPATAAGGSQSAASKAASGASTSSEIIKVISELPGLGFIK